MLMAFTSTAGLMLKPESSNWIVSSFIMVFWVLFFMVLVWALLIIVKKRLPAQLASRWFSTISTSEKKGIEILNMSSLSPRAKAYRIRVSSQEFLVVDNRHSVAIQPIESNATCETNEQQTSW